MNNRWGKCLALFLASLTLVMGLGLSAKADTSYQYKSNLDVTVDGTFMGQIPVLENDYENNLYISLRGIAYALRNTQKAFSLEKIERRLIQITPKTPYEEEPALWTTEQMAERFSLVLRKNPLFFGEQERKYASFTVEGANGAMDAFLSPLSLALLLDVEIQRDETGIHITTGNPLEITLKEIEQSGYLQGLSALLLGDASTGDLYYAYGENQKVAIASTTKLMTYFVMMDAVSAGECSLKDKVTISKAAAKLSESEDGSTPMTEGQKISMTELVYGLLLPSSNECAIAIAEHICGSVDAFVERMNDKAAALGMVDTCFINCHGLPQFGQDVFAAKVQNQMTARDMFLMASSLVQTYPEVLDITSTKNYKMETLNQTVKNTNAVLYNVEEVKGLKTGFTNKAGCCLVQCIPLKVEGETHYYISVLFGAEEDENCYLISEMMARYTKKNATKLSAIENVKGTEETVPQVEIEEDGVPSDPELVIEKILKMNIK